MPAGGGASVRIEGLSELRGKLRALENGTADLKDANARAAGFVASVAAARAPKRTGRLAASVRGNRAAGRATVSAGGASLVYAPIIHWGWPARHIEGRPFITDAARETEAVWLELYSQEIDALIARL